MALADDICLLRDRVIGDLNAVHDYHANTRIAWGIVNQFIAAGNSFAILNQVTGTKTTEADLAAKAQEYITQHLAEATFQQFISIFETFFFHLLRLLVVADPHSLKRSTRGLEAAMDE